MQNRIPVTKIGLAIAFGLAGLFAAPIDWSSSQNGNLISQANAEIGRPWTATSIAGVNRRVYRRQARRAYWGYDAAAAGASGAYVAGQYYNSNYNQNYYAGQYYGYTSSPNQYYAGQSQYSGAYPAQYGMNPAATTNSGPAYAGSYAYAPPQDVSTRTVQWCASRYRTYDMASETYVGKGGRRVSCP